MRKFFTKQFFIRSVLAGIVAMIAFTAGAWGASDNSAFGDIDTEFTVERVMAIITGLVCWFSRIAVIGLVVMMIFYGVQMLWGGGNPTLYGKAKKGFWYSVLGAIVIFGAYSIIATAAYVAGAKVAGFTILNC